MAFFSMWWPFSVNVQFGILLIHNSKDITFLFIRKHNFFQFKLLSSNYQNHFIDCCKDLHFMNGILTSGSSSELTQNGITNSEAIHFNIWILSEVELKGLQKKGLIPGCVVSLGKKDIEKTDPSTVNLPGRDHSLHDTTNVIQ